MTTGILRILAIISFIMFLFMGYIFYMLVDSLIHYTSPAQVLTRAIAFLLMWWVGRAFDKTVERIMK